MNRLRVGDKLLLTTSREISDEEAAQFWARMPPCLEGRVTLLTGVHATVVSQPWVRVIAPRWLARVLRAGGAKRP